MITRFVDRHHGKGIGAFFQLRGKLPASEAVDFNLTHFFSAVHQLNFGAWLAATGQYWRAIFGHFARGQVVRIGTAIINDTQNFRLNRRRIIDIQQENTRWAWVTCRIEGHNRYDVLAFRQRLVEIDNVFIVFINDKINFFAVNIDFDSTVGRVLAIQR